MWELIGTALIAGAGGFIGGVWWVMWRQAGEKLDQAHQQLFPPPADINEAGMRNFWHELAAELEAPVTHLILGSRTLCCGRPTRDLPLTDVLTADPALADCRG